MPRRQASPEEHYASLAARFAGEWVVLDDSHSDADWLELAREAKAFVG